jgi:hypothetical protein
MLASDRLSNRIFRSRFTTFRLVLLLPSELAQFVSHSMVQIEPGTPILLWVTFYYLKRPRPIFCNSFESEEKGTPSRRPAEPSFDRILFGATDMIRSARFLSSNRN